MKRVLFLGAVLCLCCTLQAGTEDDIKKAEKDWAAAVVSKNLAALEQILGNELIYGHGTGAVDTKSTYLSKLKTGAARYDIIEHQSITVKPYGDSAVAFSMARMTGQNKAGPFDDHVMMMHFWVKQDGKWRLVAHQTAKVQ